MAYNPELDWEEAQKLLASNQQTTPTPANQPSVWAQAQNALKQYQQYQGASNPVPQRQMPADEAPPKNDDSKTYWAMALSLLGGGKDLGSVLQNSADSYNKRLAAWEARNSPDAKLERAAKFAQIQQMDRQAANEDFQKTRELAGDARAERQITNQEKQFALTQEQQLKIQQADMLANKAREHYTEMGLNKRHTEDIASAERNRALMEAGLNERQIRDINASRDLQTQRDTAETERANEHNATQLGMKALELQNKAGAPIPGLEVKDKARVQNLTPEEKSKADELAVEFNRGQQKYERLQQLMMSPYTTSNEKEYRNTLDALIGSESKGNATNSLQDVEYLRALANKPQYAAITSAWGKLQQASGGRGTFEALAGQNPNLQYLLQLRNQHAADHNAALDVYGYGYKSGSGAPTPEPGMSKTPQQAAQPPKPSFDPVALKLPGVFRRQGAPPPQAQVHEAASQPATESAPILESREPSAGVSLRPLLDPRTGNVLMPTSLRQVQEKLSEGWRQM